VIAEAARRGWEVKPVDKSYNHRAGCAIAIRGHSYPFEISEMTDRRPLDDRELERWRRDNRYRLSYRPDLEPPQAHVPNGRLRLYLPDYHVKRANWTEGPRGPLEGKLASVFNELARRADEDDRRDAERRTREAERQRAAAERAERERLAQIEQARLDRLREEIATWRLAGDAHVYIEELRERLADLDHIDRVRVGAWCHWVEAWAKWGRPGRERGQGRRPRRTRTRRRPLLGGAVGRSSAGRGSAATRRNRVPHDRGRRVAPPRRRGTSLRAIATLRCSQ
jgi:hypothetical protein